MYFSQDIKLDDDVRLEKIAFTNSVDGECSNLTVLQQACVLGALWVEIEMPL